MHSLGTPLVVALALLVAGCVDSQQDVPGDDEPMLEPSAQHDGNESQAPDDGEDPEPDPSDNRTSDPPPPSSERPEPVEQRPWPSVDDATVRPGVQAVADGSQCTTNFLFRSLDNSSLYIGLAAHCVAEGAQTDTNGCDDAVEPAEPGLSVRVDGASEPGTLVYSSWYTMQLVEEDGDATCAFNDFALVQLSNEDRDRIHPAMLHFGGPTGLRAASSVGSLEKILSYGNSGTRMGLEPTNWHEGYALGSPNDWRLEVYTVPPGIPGDSGSGVLDGDGNALGVFVTLGAFPPGVNGVTSLSKAIEYAAEHAGIHVELVTWDVLDPGLLP